ncbi:sulfotransferase [Ktedonosporobacter rubrisoli]|uniref:Sulfotransferase n=1 Tax=Ktedonosporobacter rubrisoli TaxID=2509675 RepID=A0A4P6JYP1_KTERU|nr:sulfotransferase [Ktedonosporobacter rubrisoli]QBD80857.1 sulfotransferase [Ktedonosporobacter rubrisoli]
MTQASFISQPVAPLDTRHLTFVVGTGRCGSTMISQLLSKHPAVLSLSEFFTMLHGPKFQQGIMDAAQFWALLSAPKPRTTQLLRHGMTTPEFLYPLSDTSRFNAETGIPAILLVTLPHLTDEHEALYDEIQHVVSKFPAARIEQHYARLFAWLRQRLERRVCVERSGFSLSFISELIRLFPRARFVHIVRDGRECALSMSRHLAFRLAVLLELASEAQPEGSSSEVQQLEEQIFEQAILKQEIPLEVFGQRWSETIVQGLPHLAALPKERVLTISYERLTAQPQLILRHLLTFIDPGLVDETWIRSTAALVHEKPLAWKDLPAGEREALEVACQPGFSALKDFAKDTAQSIYYRASQA